MPAKNLQIKTNNSDLISHDAVGPNIRTVTNSTNGASGSNISNQQFVMVQQIQKNSNSTKAVQAQRMQPQLAFEEPVPPRKGSKMERDSSKSLKPNKK